MSRRTNTRIRKQHLILCEGRDAEEFLIKYLNSDALAADSRFSQDIQVMDFDGNSDLCNYLNLLKNMDGFNSVLSLLIIRDAERDAAAAQNQIITALRNAGFSPPPAACTWQAAAVKTGFLLFPDCNEHPVTGTLEDLCISILSEDSGEVILSEITEFMQHLTDTYQRSFPHEFKTKLHTYFSITDAYVSLKIGEAAGAGAFDWNNPRLNSLRHFIAESFCRQSIYTV